MSSITTDGPSPAAPPPSKTLWDQLVERLKNSYWGVAFLVLVTVLGFWGPSNVINFISANRKTTAPGAASTAPAASVPVATVSGR